MVVIERGAAARGAIAFIYFHQSERMMVSGCVNGLIDLGREVSFVVIGVCSSLRSLVENAKLVRPTRWAELLDPYGPIVWYIGMSTKLISPSMACLILLSAIQESY